MSCIRAPSRLAIARLWNWFSLGFRSRRGLTSALHDIKGVRIAGNQAKWQARIRHDVRDLNVAIKAAGKTEAQRRALEAAVYRVLQGGTADLPGAVAAQAKKMRATVDGLTRDLIATVPIAEITALEEELERAATMPESKAQQAHVLALGQRIHALKQIGAVPYELVPVLEENIGMYLRKHYRAFKEPGFLEGISEESKRAAALAMVADYRAEGLELSAEDALLQVKAYIARLLDERAAGEVVDFVGRQYLHQQNRTPYLKRKDLPAWVPELLGEYRDVETRYAASVSAIVQILSAHRFAADAAKVGVGRVFFQAATTVDGVDYTHQLPGKDSRYGALRGLFTTQEIKQALGQIGRPRQQAGRWLTHALGWIAGATFAGRAAKTIFSWTTAVRQAPSNAINYAANGFFLDQLPWNTAKDFGEAARIVLSDLLLKGPDATRPRWQRVLGMDLAHRDWAERLIGEGLFGESPGAHEMARLLEDVRDAKGIGALVDKLRLKKVVQVAGSFYGAQDDFLKVMTLFASARRYEQAAKELGWSDQEYRAELVRRVKLTTPTYSEIGHIGEQLRFAPIGNFTSYWWESYRTHYNSWAMALSDIRQGHRLGSAGLRKAGVKRLLGLVGYWATSVAGLELLVHLLAGTGADDDEYVRPFLQFQKDNLLVMIPRNIAKAWGAKDQPSFIDMTYVDPWGLQRAAMRAALAGRPVDGFYEAVRPLLQPSFGVQTAIELGLNENAYTGQQIYLDNSDHKVRKMLGHLWRQYRPGVFDQGRQLWMAWNGQTTEWGRGYPGWITLAAVGTGFRVAQVDVPRAMMWTAQSVRRELDKAHSEFNVVADKPSEKSDADIRAAWVDQEIIRRQEWKRLSSQVDAARALQFDEDTIVRALDAGGIGGPDREALLAGRYRPWIPNRSWATSKGQRSELMGMGGAGTTSDMYVRRAYLAAAEAKATGSDIDAWLMDELAVWAAERKPGEKDAVTAQNVSDFISTLGLGSRAILDLYERARRREYERALADWRAASAEAERGPRPQPPNPEGRARLEQRLRAAR